MIEGEFPVPRPQDGSMPFYMPFALRYIEKRTYRVLRSKLLRLR